MNYNSVSLNLIYIWEMENIKDQVREQEAAQLRSFSSPKVKTLPMVPSL